MKNNELRIGNLVLALTGETKYTEVLVNTIFGYGINSYYNEAEYVYDEIKPIPLTEEWLLKFGFEKKGTRAIFYTLNNVDVWELNGGFANDLDLPIKYVHQLQNLYYALTNQELTI